MINVSSEFKRLLYSGEENFVVDATITLSNNTVLNVSNSRIMSNGLEIDDAVGDDNDFNCIGSTIVNGCELILYNNDEIYSNYDFINAKVNIVVKLMTSNGYEPVQKGTYTVDAATFSDVSVTLTLLDNMCQFDRPYDSYGIYNANTTIYDVVMDACTKCGILPASSMTNMPNKTFVVAGKPKDDTTYREVIGWCAAIAGCFARCNPDGELEFAWFNVADFDLDEGTDGGVFDSGTPYYSTGDTLNGGTFNPWNDPSDADGGLFTDRSGIHYISSLMSQNIGVDDVVITAVQIAYDVETDNKVETKYYPATIANDNYVISIDSIPFINADNVASFYSTLSAKLIGLSFRTCNVTQTHDPTIEAGDIAWLWDIKGERHKVLITRTTFAVAGLQTIVCGAKTPARNSATQMTALAKANAKSNRRLNDEKSIRQQLEENFNDYVANASGLYLSEIIDSSTNARIIYGHDKPLLAESTMVLKISNGAISMTDNYTGDDATTTWYGFQFNGTWLANIISTVDLFFDHAKGGTLKLGGQNNINGSLELYNASGTKIGSIDNTGAVLTGNLVSTMEMVNVYADWISARAGFANDVPSSSSSRRLWELWARANRTTEGVAQPRHILSIESTQPGFSSKSYRNRDSSNPDLRFCICHDEKTRKGTTLLFDQLYTNGDLISTAKSNPELAYRNEAYGVSGLWIHGGLTYKDHPLGVTDKKDDVFFTVKKNYIYWGNYPDANSNAGGLRTDISRAYCEEDDEYVMQNDANAVLFKISPKVVAMGVSGGQYMDSSPGMYLTETIARINGQNVAFQSSSSLRYKHNIKPIEDKALDPHKLLDLPVVQFQWNADHQLQYADMEEQTIPGIIAEDVEKIYPSATIHKDGQVESWDERRLIPGMLALIQEQNKRIQELENKLAKLEQVVLNLM